MTISSAQPTPASPRNIEPAARAAVEGKIGVEGMVGDKDDAVIRKAPPVSSTKGANLDTYA